MTSTTIDLTFAPILAGTIDIKKDPQALEKLRFPGYGSRKIDGIRGTVRGGVVMSRKLLPLPRDVVQSAYRGLEHFDGEVTVGDWAAPDVYNTTQSYVMSGKPRPAEPIAYHVFDWADEATKHLPYAERYEMLKTRHADLQAAGYDLNDVHIVEQVLINSIEEFLAFEEKVLSEGYEGVMYRSIDGPYRVPNKSKENRSTLKEGILLKLKRCEDVEGRVVGFVEQMTNTNEAQKDNLGHTKRSSHASGMVPAGTVGKFIVEFEGRIEHVSRGMFKKPQLQEIWDNQDKYLNDPTLRLKIRHFPHGAKQALRQARALGWRDARDM